MWWLFGDVVVHRRCGGSLVVRQSSQAEVPGSNPASPTMIGAAGSMCHTVKSQGRGENLHLRPKKIPNISLITLN